jgi:membrane-bound metal-dependent hydrolase YbcI (DUF457 family)
VTGKGHKITAVSFGVLISSLILTGNLVTPNQEQSVLLISVLWFAGVVTGSSAPDWLEMSFYLRGKGKEKDRRISLIPHRTLTHWPPLWFGLAWLVWEQNYPWYAESLIFGFIASALLHIVMDSLSKSGVPILLPFAKFRMRVPLYSTGTFKEFIVVTGFMSLFVFLTWLILSGRFF